MEAVITVSHPVALLRRLLTALDDQARCSEALLRDAEMLEVAVQQLSWVEFSEAQRLEINRAVEQIEMLKGAAIALAEAERTVLSVLSDKANRQEVK